MIWLPTDDMIWQNNTNNLHCGGLNCHSYRILKSWIAESWHNSFDRHRFETLVMRWYNLVCFSPTVFGSPSLSCSVSSKAPRPSEQRAHECCYGLPFFICWPHIMTYGSDRTNCHTPIQVSPVRWVVFCGGGFPETVRTAQLKSRLLSTCPGDAIAMLKK